MELPGSGCKMLLVLLLPFKRTYPNGNESYVYKEVNYLQTLAVTTKRLMTRRPPEWDTSCDVTSGLVPQNIATTAFGSDSHWHFWGS